MAAEPSWPEPGPSWPEAIETWDIAWPVHVYLIGSIWAIAAVYFLFFLAQSIYFRNDGHKRLPFIMLSFQLLIEALSRCFILFLNPYGSRSDTKVQLVSCITIWSLGTAGLTSAFGVLLLILLDATKLNLGPPMFQNLTVLTVITAANFIFVVVSDIVVAFHSKAKALLLICQVAFALWGIVIAIGYFMAAHRLRKNLTATFDGFESKNSEVDPRKLKKLIVACYISSWLGLCIFGVSLYVFLLGAQSVLSNTVYVESWKYWAFQTTFRVLEILMTLVITVVALKTSKYH